MRVNDVLSDGIPEPSPPSDGGAMLSVTVRRGAGRLPGRAFSADAPAAPRAPAPAPQVVGASGDLAKKKIFPALFALYYEGTLPKVRRGGQTLFRGVALFRLRAYTRLTPAPAAGRDRTSPSWALRAAR